MSMNDFERAEARDRAVLKALALLREADGDRQAPPHAAESVLAAFRQRRRVRSVAWAWGAVAAVLLGGVLLLRQPAPQPDEGTDQAEMATGFIPLTAGPLEPDESLQMLRIELPRAELRRFGFAVRPEYEGGLVRADVVVSPDGVARAVRFVREQ